MHDGGNFLGQILEHLDSLLEFAELAGTHGEPPADVDHHVGVSPVLGLHQLVLMLKLLRSPIIRLRNPERLLESDLGITDVLGLKLMKLDLDCIQFDRICVTSSSASRI